MNFNLTILGSNSALPAFGRFTTSQVLEIGNELILIDAGEAVQLLLSKHNIRRSKISSIYISHLHGDHILGLPGLLNSYSLNGRKEPLRIYGPEGLQGYIQNFFKISQSHITYSLEFITLTNQEETVIYECDNYEVVAFPVEHRVPTWGFLFKERQNELRIKAEKIEEYGLSIDQIKRAKAGETINLGNGSTLLPEELCYPKFRDRTYAFCADTVFTRSYIDTIAGVSLLYHEATYMEDLQKQAHERMHCTAKEAGIIAKEAGVEQLVIGHFSSRYKDLSGLLEEAQAVFANTHLALEGSEFILDKK